MDARKRSSRSLTTAVGKTGVGAKECEGVTEESRQCDDTVSGRNYEQHEPMAT
jgi:hypothetical protein